MPDSPPPVPSPTPEPTWCAACGELTPDHRDWCGQASTASLFTSEYLARFVAACAEWKDIPAGTAGTLRIAASRLTALASQRAAAPASPAPTCPECDGTDAACPRAWTHRRVTDAPSRIADLFPASDAPAPPRELCPKCLHTNHEGRGCMHGVRVEYGIAMCGCTLPARPAQEASPDDWLMKGPLRDKLVTAITVHFVDGTTQRIDR